MNFLIVFLGAGVGGALRHGVNSLGMRLLGTDFPYATLTVNIVGSLAMGLLAGWFAQRGEASQHFRLFLTTGILGGFTTFSTYAVDIRRLVDTGHAATGLAYLAATALAALGSVWAAATLTRRALTWRQR